MRINVARRGSDGQPRGAALPASGVLGWICGTSWRGAGGAKPLATSATAETTPCGGDGGGADPVASICGTSWRGDVLRLLPPAAALVSGRWLALLRASTFGRVRRGEVGAGW
ncbi:hypothetical protein BRADI_1g60485v3 [Brachypodium distachyon]|uniref:Uncharacterized protein n=1 Tax=Brachypodium distachyon TaxID=15368 RepID=A0A2K2DSN9_BRADI|nr:hypothetical protein BRADI_1g60485v3 [Brachypodium distachyon]